MSLRVHELIWDDWNVDHIARHGVTAGEVEQVCFNEETRFTRAGGGRYQAVGQTDVGRYLTVILDREGQGRYYPVTARPSDESERRLFRRRR
jgi:uncharacterized DUF497 family protein